MEINNIMREQYSNAVFTLLSQLRYSYSSYIEQKQKISLTDSRILLSEQLFKQDSDSQYLMETQRLSNEKFNLMLRLQDTTNKIAHDLHTTIQNAIQALQISISSNDMFNVMLDDNTIANVCTYIDLISSENSIIEKVKLLCRNSNLMLIFADIRLKHALLSTTIVLNGFNRLSKLLI